MRFTEKIEVVKRIDQLIRIKATGTSRELAKRLGISKTTVYEIIEIMKFMGADIDYCNKQRSFFYLTDKVLMIEFVKSDCISKK